MSKELTQEEMDYIWSLMPTWVKTIDEGEEYNPMFYGTLSRDGDIEVHDKVKELLNQNKDE